MQWGISLRHRLEIIRRRNRPNDRERNRHMKIQDISGIVSGKLRSRRAILMTLAVIAVFITTYVLILPAITLDKDEAQKQGGIDVNTQTEAAKAGQSAESASEQEQSEEAGTTEETPALSEAEDDNASDSDAMTGNSAGSLTAKGKGYSVSAMYDENAGLPENTELTTQEIDEKDKDYDTLQDLALKAVQKKDGKSKSTLQFSKFYDISLMADGEEQEPSASVDVTISYDKALAVEKASDVHIIHFTENEKTGKLQAEVLEQKDVDLTVKKQKLTEAAFEADSFSVYGVVYTVDFEYSVNGKMYQYSLLGGGFVSFTDLVEVLGITGDTNSGNNEDENEEVIEEITEENGVNERAEENGVDSDTNTAPILDEVEVSESARKFVADVASVEFSSPELVDVSKVEEDTTVGQIKENRALECKYSAGLTEEQIAEINAQTVEAPDWALISLHPFTSEEELTVTMEDGEVFTIRVTDAQIKKNVIDSKGDTWEIIVTCGEDAQIPDGAELKVREILPEDEEYVQYYKKSLEKVGVNAPETEEPVKKVVSDYARLFDIEIWYDDHKVEPAADVTVNIKLLDAPEETEATPQVVHFAKAGAELIELKEKAEKSEEEGIQFVTDEFSVYSVVYTVDFSYEVNGKVYGFTMQGEGSVSLRALIEALHVYEKTACEEKSDDKANEVEAFVTSEDLADNEAEQESSEEIQALNEFMSDIISVEFSNPELLAVCEAKEDTTLGQLNTVNGIVQKYTLTAPEPELKKYNAKEFKAGDWALISLKPFDTEECLKIGLTTGEKFTIKVTDAQDAQMVGDHVLTVSNPAGTTIDLFDYWINDDLRYTVGRGAWPGGYDGKGWTNDWEYQDIGLLVEGQGTEAGINEGHAFKFTPAYAGTVRDGTTNYKTVDSSGRINSYTGSEAMGWFCPDPNQGIVQNTLSSGYPILTNDSAKGTNGESLAYLFDPTISHQGKESYSGVDQFLYVDKDGYYRYDSRDYKADYNYDGTFTLTEQTAEGSDRGFWPFGTSTYWSGMHINAQFSMPENGKVLNPRGEYKDMQFEFSGDDDTWIYVDGVLIGDGGGIHNRCEIDINFATGNVIINNTAVGTLRGFIEAAKSAEIAAFTPEELEKWNAQWNGNTFAAGTYHTFDMFYLERGGDESNLYIKYNLVSTADFTAHKSYSGYDEDDVMQRNQFRFELIGLDGKYRSVWNDDVNDYVLVREDMTSKAIMPHASSTGAGTTVSPYYDDNYSVEMSDGTTVSSQIYITGNVEDGNVNFGNAQISEQDMHDCDEGNPPVYRYIVREVVPDDAVNADNITWANATPEQRAAGGFVKDSIVYDNAVYYMAARVTSWTETDASGTPRTRYGLSKTYYTDDTYTTKKNTPFIDFRNTYQPNFASFEFDKLDANEEPVEGAVFQLFRDSSCKIPAKDSNNQNITAASDANGKVTFTDTRTGIYFMKEVSAPEPYDLNPTVYRVTISKQGSHMSVNSDQNNTPVTEVYNLKSTDITVKKKWVNEDGEEVSGEGHPATVQLRRYRYVSTAPAPETHNVTLHFYFPDVGWNTSQMDFGPYQVTGNSVVIHWPEEGVAYRSREGYDDLIIKGNNMYSLQLPLENDLDLNFEGNVDWGYQKLNSDLISVDGTYDNSKELRLDDAFPSEAEKSKATQVLTDEHPMHAWSFGVGDEFDFPPGDELGRYLYYIVELNDQEQEVAIGENVDEDMKLLSIAYEPEKVEGKGITHGLITVTNEVAAETPTTVDITVLKVDDDNNNIKLGGATFELTKVQSLETVNQVSDGGYSESGTTSDADDETKGKLLFTGLTPGYYYLHETESPDGYVIRTNGWHFQVDENGIVSGVGDFDPDGSFRYVDENNIEVTNQKGVALPNTGGPGTRLYTILGTILILGAGVLLCRRRRLI